MPSQYEFTENHPKWGFIKPDLDSLLFANSARPTGTQHKDSSGSSMWSCYLTLNTFIGKLDQSTAVVYVNHRRGLESEAAWASSPDSTYRTNLISILPEYLSRIKALYGLGDNDWLVVSPFNMNREEYKIWSYIVDRQQILRDYASDKTQRYDDSFNLTDFLGKMKVSLTRDYDDFFRLSMPMNYNRLFEIGLACVSPPSTFGSTLYYSVHAVEERFYSSHPSKTVGFVVNINSSKELLDKSNKGTVCRWQSRTQHSDIVESGELDFTVENQSAVIDNLEKFLSNVLGTSTAAMERNPRHFNSYFSSIDVNVFGRSYFADVGREGKIMLRDEYSAHWNNNRGR